jgi:hypothetical protein
LRCLRSESEIEEQMREICRKATIAFQLQYESGPRAAVTRWIDTFEVTQVSDMAMSEQSATFDKEWLKRASQSIQPLTRALLVLTSPPALSTPSATSDSPRLHGKHDRAYRAARRRHRRRRRTPRPSAACFARLLPTGIRRRRSAREADGRAPSRNAVGSPHHQPPAALPGRSASPRRK